MYYRKKVSKHHRKKINREIINRLFVKKPTSVHCNICAGTVKIIEAVSNDDVENFGKISEKRR